MNCNSIVTCLCALCSSVGPNQIKHGEVKSNTRGKEDIDDGSNCGETELRREYDIAMVR